MTTALTEETRAESEGLPEDLEPLTVAASGGAFGGTYGQEYFLPGDQDVTVDTTGSPFSLVGNSLDAEIQTDGIANSRAIRLALDGGVVNGDFREGPPNPSAPIGPNNPLPGWRVGGGTADSGIDSMEGLQIFWREEDDGQGYGSHIEFIADDLAGEVYAERLIYMEQVVPIASRERVLGPRALASYDGGSAIYAYIVAKPYYLDGTEAGSAVIAEQGFGNESSYASGGQQFHQTPVEAAQAIVDNRNGGQYMLLRLMGYTNNDVLAPPESVKVYEVSNAPPSTVDVTVMLETGSITTTNGPTDTNWLLPAAYGASTMQQYYSFSTGWVSGIGLRTDADRTNGQLSIAGWSGSQTNHIGPRVKIDGNHRGSSNDNGSFLHTRGLPYYADTLAKASQAQNIDDSLPWNIFAAGERIHGKGWSHGSSNFQPSGVGSVMGLTMTCVMEDGAVNDNV